VLKHGTPTIWDANVMIWVRLANCRAARCRPEDIPPDDGNAVRNPLLCRSGHQREGRRSAQGCDRPTAVDHRDYLDPTSRRNVREADCG
jgi:hypothetical protein